MSQSQKHADQSCRSLMEAEWIRRYGSRRWWQTESERGLAGRERTQRSGGHRHCGSSSHAAAPAI